MMTVESGAELDVGYTLTNQIHQLRFCLVCLEMLLWLKKYYK